MQLAKLAVPTAAKLMRKLKNKDLGPVKCAEKGDSNFQTPRATPIEVVTAAVYTAASPVLLKFDEAFLFE